MAEVKDEFNLTEEAVQKIKKEAEVPAGYITVNLSTQGRFYAPAEFHIRNFTTEDLLGIAIADDDTLPIKVITCLQKLIWEKDVKVADFHENEVSETLFILYKTFYESKLKDLEYELTEDDWEFLAKQHGGRETAEFRKQEKDILNKRWVPHFDIDLNQVQTYDLPDDFKYIATVRKPSGFTCKYAPPRYGDVLVIKEFSDNVFAEKDHQFARLANKISIKQDIEKRLAEGENVSAEAIPIIDPQDMEKYTEYLTEKSVFFMVATRAIHLVEYKGEDVSNKTLAERFNLAKDPELDYSTFKILAQKFSELKIGLNPNIKVYDPIQSKVVDYEYTFRLFTLIQAITNNDAAGITIDFE